MDKRLIVNPLIPRGQPGVSVLLCLWVVSPPVIVIIKGTLVRNISDVLFISAIPIFVFIFGWATARFTTLTITEDRVTLRSGILTRKTNDVLICDIRNIQISQGPFQRLTNTGMIGVSSAGQADIEIEIDGIGEPHAVKAFIDKYRKVNDVGP